MDIGKKETIYVNAPFPTKLERQARIQAAKLGISRAELVRRAVKEYLQRLEKYELLNE